MSALLPCPFCGGEAARETFGNRTVVHCPSLECAVSIEADYTDASAAIAAWNGRASPWMPIETAPRDGTRIHIINDRGQFIVEWEDDWWRVENGKMYASLRGDEPTHWQPLPQPPEPTP